MASAVPAAKTTIKTLLTAHTWPVSTPDIRWGQPTEGEDWPAGGEVIYMGDTRPATDQFVVLGANRLDEAFVIPVVADVRQYGDDEEATEKRAWVLRDEIVAVLQANPTLGGTVNRLTGFTRTPGNLPSPQQWRTQILIEPAYVAYETFPVVP